MDLALFGRVIWRFRMLVLPGLLLALLIATLSFVRIGPSGISYRQKEQWVSYSTLFVTQNGFAWGSLQGQPGRVAGGHPGANPQRLSDLAILYSQLATSDPVMQRLAGPSGNLPHIEAAPVLTEQGTGDALPFVRIAAFSDTQPGAVALAHRASTALRGYVQEEQAANGIAAGDRVDLAVTNHARSATLFAGRSKTLPIVIFLTVSVAVIGLAFILENLRPRIRRVDTERQAPKMSGAA